MEAAAAGAGLFEVRYRHTGERLGFGFVGNDVIGVGGLGEIEWLARSGIQDRADAVEAGEAQCVIDGNERDFELEHDAIRGAEQVGGGVDIGRQEAVVGAFDDQDAVLAGAIDENRRDAAGDTRGDPDVRGVDGELLEIGDGSGAEEVVAHAGDHGHAHAAEPGGDGLVGAFAAEAQVKFAAEDGFAGTGEGVGEGGEVDVGAADNHDVGGGHTGLF